MKTIGILGDGQLALMLGEAAEQYQRTNPAQHVDFIAFGHDPDSSFARQFPERWVRGNANDALALTEFAKRCSILTLENEFFKLDQLKQMLDSSNVPLVPGLSSYQHFESKISQRNFFTSLEIDSPRYVIPSDVDAVLPFDFPVVVKASQGGYDGYGVCVANDVEEYRAAYQKFKNSVVVEEKVKIDFEFAQGAIFDGRGNACFLPIVETVQKNGICELVLSRPQMGYQSERFKLVKEKIHRILNKIAQSQIEGLFSFEFFITPDDRVLINEGAPRPHNSQHLSMSACSRSQFDLLIQYLVENQCPKNDQTIEPAVMINLLGQANTDTYQLVLPQLPDGIRVDPKLYLKKQCRVGRKMGHLNLVDLNGNQDLAKLARTVIKEYRLS